MGAAALVARYRHWVDSSLANRFSAAAMALTGVAVVTLALVTYAAISSLLTDRVHAQIEAQAGAAAARLRFQLESLVQASRDLAGRTLVRTALADSAGRQVYLGPFVREFRDSQPGIWAVELTDFRGRSLDRKSVV